MTEEEKIEKLVGDLKRAYKKNHTLTRANKSLRLQLHQASKKTLSQKTKHEVVKEVMSVRDQRRLKTGQIHKVFFAFQPFFTPTQIDCFCRPSWLRSRNWSDQDFELALSLRRLMSKKAFSVLRKKRLVPMPSLTSLRKYQREHCIVIHHNPNKTGSNLKGTSKKKAKRVIHAPTGASAGNTAITTTNKSYSIGGSKVIQAINVPVQHQVVNTGYDGQQIQIVNHNGATIGTVQGMLGNSSNIQTIQLQVVEAAPPPPTTTKVTKIANKTLDDNWKFIQVTPDGQTTTYIQQK